jgi:hypothetical protein
MGGTITVESTPGRGTLFVVLLPVQNEAAPRKEDFRPLSSPLPLSPPSFNPRPFAEADAEEEKPLLLLIEDNADVVRYIVGLLTPTYEVITATDGLSAETGQAEQPHPGGPAYR